MQCCAGRGLALRSREIGPQRTEPASMGLLSPRTRMNPKWWLGMEGRAPSEGGASLSCGRVTRSGPAGRGQKWTEEGSSLWLQGFGVLRWDRR